jgi:periplasmic protein TonB
MVTPHRKHSLPLEAGVPYSWGILIAALRLQPETSRMTAVPYDAMTQLPPSASPNSRFLAGEVPTAPGGFKQLRDSVGWSIGTHLVMAALLLWVFTRPLTELRPAPQFETPPDITWLATPGPGGGGGGGGNKSPDPPKRAELKGVEKITVPVEAKPKPVQKEVTPPTPALNIPAQVTASSITELPGLISQVPTLTPSQGSGEGGGSGTGRGTGSGPGSGSGLGPGSGGGTGGGEYRLGSAGIVSPTILHEEKPQYTSEAMRAKIQGDVEIEAAVLPDGSVGRIRITKSLDDRFGLDQKAIEAVRRWRFRPGTRFGQPATVVVDIILTFTLR